MPRKKTTTPKTSKTKPKAAAAKKRTPTKKQPSAKAFPIVGLGASAGGLEALKAFFAAVPKTSGFAYIVVVHMTPKQPSMMPGLLQNITAVPVLPAEDGQSIEPNHVYVIPPDKEITVYKGKIQLLDLVQKAPTLPIDMFLRSLANDQQNKAIAIILSGTGTDGTLGIKEIKANDGLVVVQDQDSAGYDGMPGSAISTGLVDIVLPPDQMPEKLIKYFNQSGLHLKPQTTTTTTTTKQNEWLIKIYAILRTHVGHDFSAYKANTILRRIARRMGLNHIDSHQKYVRYLRENPTEIDALFRELLIGVTNFFRDAESFDNLKKQIFPEILNAMGQDATFRAWVPGCSTGEEVYSLAMVLRECLDKATKQINIQLFGTDIDSQAIERAREGLFPSSISADVSKERLGRFFIKEGDFFRIRKEIRDCVVFSAQDVIKDPPFSRLNLLCCRNLLIYLNTDAQKKLLPLFHYTLNPDGILILGSSETIGGFSNLFKTLDKKWKIFQRREVPRAMRQIVDFPSGPAKQELIHDTMQPVDSIGNGYNIGQLTQKAVLDQFAPTAILTDAKGNILHVQGRTGKYLETPSGPPTNNILDLAREGLRIELSSALRAAKSSLKSVTRKRIMVKTNGEMQTIDLHICPQKIPKEMAGNYLIVFEDIDMESLSKAAEKGLKGKPVPDAKRLSELERELQITRESHQTTIEELESSNEELKSTNEEMQSSNEELQSTNEEMESSKEELQSLNEELQTVNSELQSKVEELSAAHDDMRNLLNSTEIATIFVDNDMRIRRFTPKATEIVNLIQTDIGRPLKHVVSNLKYDQMINDLKAVIKKLTPKEIGVETSKGTWFNMRIIPYRTTDNRIDGAVLTFSAIVDQKNTQLALEQSVTEIEISQELVRAIFDMHDNPLLVMDKNGKIIIANDAFKSVFEMKKENLRLLNLFDEKAGLLKSTDIEEKLISTASDKKEFHIDETTLPVRAGKRIFSLKGQIIKTTKALSPRILLSFKQQG